MLHKYIIKDLFMPHYKKWLKIRKGIMDANGEDHNFIFIRKNGTPAIEGTVRSWFVRWERFLGVPFYPHALRHYIVTYLTTLGVEQDFIIEIMGWTSVEMYKIYCDLTAKERKWKNLDNIK